MTKEMNDILLRGLLGLEFLLSQNGNSYKATQYTWDGIPFFFFGGGGENIPKKPKKHRYNVLFIVSGSDWYSH